MAKKKIAIFVSHRIDLESECIKNPLYHHMRCGAVYDEREGISIAGDDTGDNISEKRNSFCEFTVQYWAWKNYDADYYGLCHYRRYLSFADQHFETEEPHGFVVEGSINKETICKHNMLNQAKMRKEIEQYDVITSVTYPVDQLPFYPRANTMRDIWENHYDIMIYEKDLELAISLIEKNFPQYYNSVLEVLNLDVHRGFNCFIMKKEYFQQMCEFEFAILFDLERQIDISSYGGKLERTLGYIGEILYGTYIHWLSKQEDVKILEKQIVLFRDTKKEYIPIKKRVIEIVRKYMRCVFPAYRVALRLEQELAQSDIQILGLRREVNEVRKELRAARKQFDALKNLLQLKFWIDQPVLPANMDEVRQNFWDSYPSADGDLRLLQKANAVLLNVLKELSDSLGIKFWLHGGSLVGAIRHGGCIPWDDDIDVGMMRSDLEKLKNYLQKNPYYEIAEYYYTGLACRSYRFMRKDIAGNFFVDIFPYDYYVCTTESLLSDWIKVRTFKEGLSRQYIALTRSFQCHLGNERIDERPELKEPLDKLIDSYIQKFQSPVKTQHICWGMDNNFENQTRFAWRNGRIFTTDEIFPLKPCVYEGVECYVPSDFKKYIFAEYGIDYLEMPSNIGHSAHIKQYFGNQDIYPLYQELMEKIDERSTKQKS